MNKVTNHKKIVILAISPLVLSALGIWVFVFDYGKYIEVTGTVLTKIPNVKQFSITGTLPSGVKIYSEGGYLVIEQPLPAGAKINIVLQPWYSAARDVNIMTYNFLVRFGNPNAIMDTLGTIVIFSSIILATIEIAYNSHNKKNNRPTIVSFYKIVILHRRSQFLINL